jgi:biotin carboxyl carrier protein
MAIGTTIAPPHVQSAQAASSEPSRPFQGTVAESLAVVVAPSTGRFRPETTLDHVEKGHVIGHVTGGRERADEVRMPIAGQVRALLARPGQLVYAGQALAWLDRSARL